MARPGWQPAGWREFPAAQQPPWPDGEAVAAVGGQLAARPPLTTPDEVRQLHFALARVQAGRAFLLQGGDCAEPLGQRAVDGARAKHRILGLMAARIRDRIGLPVLTVGRLAGQFAKPRSHATETVDGRTMPVFRGLMVNGPDPDPRDRRPNPYRMLAGYHAADLVLRELRALGGPWASHEALVLDYEQALTRRDPVTGEWFLLSTHLPWLGERTRRVDGAHVEFLAGIANPVACKVGPDADPDEILRLCERLDPLRTPGRLTLISRMGSARLRDRLPSLVTAVQRAGHPVLWVCDPMHGNTVTTSGGVKTRHVNEIVAELDGFLDVLRDLGEWPAGVHLELAGDDVTECVGGAQVASEADLAGAYRSLCDPRLNDEQALTLADRIAALLS